MATKPHSNRLAAAPHGPDDDRGERTANEPTADERTESDHTNAVISALVANFVIMCAKYAAAFVTGTSALIAEAIHSTADTCNQALLLFGSKRSQKPADDKYPFGYGQELYFWSLVVAIILFGLGGGLSIWEGVARLLSRHPSSPGGGSVWWNYGVLAVALAAEAAALGYTLKKWRQKYAKRPFWETVKASKDPRMFIPLAEDIAAVLGVIVAFLGVFLARVFDLPALDAAASIVIGCILAVVAFFLAYQTRGLLIGERVDQELLDSVTAAAERDPGVDEVVTALTMHLGPDEILLNLGLHFAEPATGAAEDITAVVRRVERRVRHCDRRITRIFIEPDASGRPDIQPPL